MSKHASACTKYKKDFIKKHEYLFCEFCTVNANGTPRFETHHIVYASEAPNHENLHHKRNLILLCCRCHKYFHASKKNRDTLVKERKLEELFNRKLNILNAQSKNKALNSQ
jgi:predicted HNH restriction endonuclease|tara:strand:- start:2309 stop:2641 length:333 start_codon:yes stop_codon:yes gene_type:complete